MALQNAFGDLALDASVQDLVRAGLLSKDVFGNVITGLRDNQIEVHFDDVNWASYVNTTQTAGGGAVQHEGHVHFTTSTNTNGKSKAVTLDTVKYRPMHEVYDGWTAAFPTPGVANSWLRIGMGDDTNAAFVGYEGTSLGLTWRRAGVVAQFVPRAGWDDPLTGQAGSRYTRNGVPEAWNPAFTNVFRARVGLLGSAPLIYEILSPDGEWVAFHTIKRPNVDSEPTFTNFDLPMFVDVGKNGAGATDLEVRTACWAGGTTSPKSRISEAITDRNLADTVRSVIWGKTPSGNYVGVALNAQGRLLVSNDSVGTDGAALPAGVTAVGGSDGTLLQTFRVQADGTLYVDPGDGITRNLLAATATVDSGTPLTITPTAGKAIRLWWLTAIPSPDNATTGRITATLGGKGEIYRSYAIGHRQRFDGAINGTLVVASAGGTYEVTAHYEEI